MSTRTACVVPRSGGPDVLQLRQEPVPSPGPGEVLIEVAFAGVNFADLAIRLGFYAAAPKPPMVPGFEVSGYVRALGPDAPGGLAIGDRVLAAMRFGGYATHVCARADSCRRLPDAMTLEQGAAIPVAYATAWFSLTEVGRLRPGEWVLIHAAAGGVGVAATQLAQHLGLRTIGTASSAEKLAFCREQGLEHGIDYVREDFAERVLAITEGKGVRLVLDSVAGAILEKSFACVGVNGLLLVIGAGDLYPRSWLQLPRTALALARMKRFTATELIEENRGVAGLQLLRVWDARGELGSVAQDLLDLYEKGVVRPVIDRVFPLSKAADAHRYLGDRRTKGKVLLDARRT